RSAPRQVITARRKSGLQYLHTRSRSFVSGAYEHHRPLHVGVDHVRLPHHFHQSLIAGLALSDRPPDDDVAHRCESERLRDLHRKLPGRIMLDLLHGALRRALPSEQRRERHEAGDDQRDEGEPGHFWHGQCLHRKLLELQRIFLMATITHKIRLTGATVTSWTTSQDESPSQVIEGRQARPERLGIQHTRFFRPAGRLLCEGFGRFAHGESRDLVKALHKAGIEVILDVVFNHTDEGNQFGPVFSFKGIDNSSNYLLDSSDKHIYSDYTGCGNTFNCNHPVAEKLIIDCLRHWVRDTHVDGFRFDEGSILSRGEDGRPLVHPPVVWQIELDEELAESKLIADAWAAAGLYQIGRFPGDRWAEWNGRFRDDLR